MITKSLELAVTTNTTTGVWVAEFERDERAVWTVLDLIEQQDRERRRRES